MKNSHNSCRSSLRGVGKPQRDKAHDNDPAIESLRRSVTGSFLFGGVSDLV